MAVRFRPLLGAAVVTLAVAVAALATVRRAPDPPDEPPLPADHSAAERTGPAAARILAHEAVAREVAAGRLTLSPAAAVFDWLNNQDPPLSLHMLDDRPWDGLTPGWGGWTPVEAAHLHVIRWVSTTQTRDDPTPDQAAGVRSALVAEFEAGRSCGRPLPLPAVSEAGCRRLLGWATATFEAGRHSGHTPRWTDSSSLVREAASIRQ